MQERKYFDSGDYALSKAGKASDTGVTSIGTEHPSAENIPHASPLNHTISRSDSITSASPPSHQNSPSIATAYVTNNPLAAVGAGDGSSPTLNGPSPAGMHRGSINGIPGGGLQSTPSISGIQNSRSPNKESYLNRSASIDDAEDENMKNARDMADEMDQDQDLRNSVSPPPKKEGIPIRR